MIFTKFRVLALPGCIFPPALILTCIFLLPGCSNDSSRDQLLLIQGHTMGTSYFVKIYEANLPADSNSIKLELEHILDDINSHMSTYIPDSELSEINKAGAGEWLLISPILYDVLNASRRISNITSGHFDITVGPLVNLWGFGPASNNPGLPGDEDIHHVLERTGMDKIQLRESPAAIRKDRENVYIDLSAVAKGYSVDELGAYLKSLGLRNYLVEIGGEILAQGHNNSNHPWNVGIERPTRDERKVHRAIQLSNIAMATSGDYRNFRKIGGEYYSHSIDPKSGWPVQHNLASVTVLHQSATDADALATGLLVMGKKKALHIAEQLQLPVLFIERNGDEFIESHTPAMAQYLQHKQN